MGRFARNLPKTILKIILNQILNTNFKYHFKRSAQEILGEAARTAIRKIRTICLTYSHG